MLGGICTVCLLKTVLAEKDAVLVDVAVVVSARLILCASLELVIVLLAMDIVGDFAALIFPKKIRNH